MATTQVSVLPSAMLTRWRRRRLCTLVRAHGPATPAVLHHVDGLGAQIECASKLDAKEQVVLRHPEAGEIAAQVTSVIDGRPRLGFAVGTASVAFALAVIASDMSSPG